jgi:hypothetical protein
MKNAIIIGSLLLVVWYFFFKKKAVLSPGAHAIDPALASKEAVQRVDDFLVAPGASLVNTAKTNYENIAALTLQPTPVMEIDERLSTYLQPTATEKEKNDVLSLLNGEKWKEGMYNPFGRELTPEEKSYIRNRFIPIARLVMSPSEAQGYIDTLNSDRYSLYIFEAITQIEAAVKNAQQKTDNVQWQKWMPNKNPYYENGILDPAKTPVVPEVLRNYKYFMNLETGKPL